MVSTGLENDSQVRQTVVDLIENGSIYNVEKLDELYLDDMKIIHITSSGRTNILHKKEVLEFFGNLKKNNTKPLDTNAHFNHVEANNDIAHVVVTRTTDLTGKLEKSIYNLCLVKKNDAWKVAKETVVTV